MIKRTTLPIALLLLLLAAVGPQSQAAADPNEVDSLWIDSTTAFVTGIGVVPISFFNDEYLSSVEVTMEHGSSDVKVDSFSFAGGRVDTEELSNEVQINLDSSVITVLSLSLSGPPIPPGRGLLGHLYYSYSQTIPPQLVPIDTVTWFDGPIRHTTAFRELEATEDFVPYTKTGYLDIIAAPVSYDSIWVDYVEAAPGDPVAVNVYSFNERNVAKITLALDYTSPALLFDSVSFVGTRSESAPSKTVQPQTGLHKVYTVVEYADAAPLPPGTGLMAILHFTVDPSTPEALIPIDTTTVGIISNTRYFLTSADGNINFEPLFSSGGVDVKITTDVEDITDGPALPTDYSLAQNYPNPFNPSTNIEFSLPEGGHVELAVFNVLGRRVKRLINRDLPAGVHRLIFDGRTDRGTPLASGVYFYRMTTDQGFEETKKMLMIK